MGVLQSSKNVFIVGIKGVAMAGLARILTQMGKQVSGSDTDESQITDELLNTLQIAHSKLDSSVPVGTDLVVYSAAHGGVDSFQVKDAQNRKIAVISQAALIAELIGIFPKSIAICGSHGKTTTSSMTAFVLQSLGAKVSWLVGAPYFSGYVTEQKETLTQFPGGHFEEGSEVFVFEADEYGVCPPTDKTPKILLYNPTHIICTNIDFDHPDIYQDLKHVQKTFDTFYTHAQHVYECHSQTLEGNLVGVRKCLADLGFVKSEIDEH
ncbi:hypothetical protein KBB12_04665, partial [Candidatus Woesebacteria bacterium]|nr:hypothetical protein [Candidatus Woesebacteria bacterium]